jgi:hypothetical protein
VPPRLAFLVVLAWVVVAACAAPPADEPHRAALRAPATEQLLPWGSGPAEVGLRPAVTEHPALGPSAIAVAPDGAPLVLDRLNRRVLRLAADGRPPQVAAQVPEDAEDLAVARDGTLALYSPWRARVWVHGGGTPVEMAVPRQVREIRGVALGPSRQVLLHTAYQETFSLGSPSVPQTTTAILGQRREGEVLLADGRGAAVHLRPDGRPEVLLRRPGERLDSAARFGLPERVRAARVVGAAGRAVCLRLEQVDAQAAAGPAFTVQRQVVCHDVEGGARLLRRDLPAPGLYLPAREVAVGGSPARVAYLEATAAGLRDRAVPQPAKPEEVAP